MRVLLSWEAIQQKNARRKAGTLSCDLDLGEVDVRVM
jgi:hypothetical protein